METKISVKFGCGHVKEVEIYGQVDMGEYKSTINLGMCIFKNITSIGVCPDCKK